MGIRVFVNNLQRWADRLRQELETQLNALGTDPSAIPWFEDSGDELLNRSVVLFSPMANIPVIRTVSVSSRIT